MPLCLYSFFLDFPATSIHNIPHMGLTTETVQDNSLTLIVSNPGHPLAQSIASYHAEHDVRVIQSTHIPPKLNPSIRFCYCLTSVRYLAEDAVALADIPHTVLIAGITAQPSHRDQQIIKLILRHYPHVKVALIPEGNHDMPIIIERLMYFSFDEKLRYTVITSTAIVSETDDIKSSRLSRRRKSKSLRDAYISVISRPMRFIVLLVALILLIHTAYLVPLGLGVAETAWQASRLSRMDSGVLSREQVISDPFSHPSAMLVLGRKLYNPIRRGWLFVGLASFPERLFDVTEHAIGLYHLAQETREYTDVMVSKMFDPKAVSQDQILEKKTQIKDNLESIQDSIRIIRSQVPASILKLRDIDVYLSQTDAYITLGLKLLDSFDSIFAKNSQRIYGIFFANDREIRPGGGFIGSFALVKLKNTQIQEWKVYDVYDADGQLKARVPPPEAISKYLKQPFYFLRDSAFTPDSPTNAIVAEDFLQKELGITKLDGAVMVTFSSIEKLLSDIGPVYLSEYQDTISNENVYVKTQLYAEQDFFPGSTQKKDFLQALTTQILMHLGEPKMSFQAMGSIRQSLDEKLITVYFHDPSVQTLFDSMYWSGRQLTPSCITQNVPVAQTCIPLYIFPVEANLGVNKANAFVRRDYEYKVRVLAPDGIIESEFIAYFENDSYPDVFPGGTYKNYYQLYLPPDVMVQSVRVDDTIANDVDISKDKYTHLSLWLEIPPQAKKRVSIKYRTALKLPKENSQIQVIFQKQIGLPSTDIAFKFQFPDGYSPSETNFSPLAQDTMVEYNSTIDSDKFYYIHF